MSTIVIEDAVSQPIVLVDDSGDISVITISDNLNADEKVKVSSNDTTAGYLNGKLVAGSNVTLTENNNGSNETLTVGLTGVSLSGHTHVEADITDLQSYALDADLTSHTGDTSVHFTKSSINLDDLGNVSVPTPSDGQVLTYDTINGWNAETPSSGVTDHTALSNIGTNTHAQIDTHIADTSVHFTQASISITESQISDFGSYEPANANIQSHIGSTSNPHSVTADQVLPTQTGNSGKYLTTNGTTASWAAVGASVTEELVLSYIIALSK